MKIKNKKILTLLLTMLLLLGAFPQKTHAHRAYFMQILIDEDQNIYTGSVIKDSSLTEANKTEAKLWDYSPLASFSDYKDLENSTTGENELLFTFPPKAIKGMLNMRASNNATGKDINRAFTISDTLVPNLNEILLFLNDGSRFSSTQELINTSERLIALYENGGSITSNKGAYTVSYSRGSDSMTVSGGGSSTDYVVRMKKGYSKESLENGAKSPVYNPDFDFDGNKDTISIRDIAIQGNYTYIVKGHSSFDAFEYSSPGTMERLISELLSSFMYSLRGLLGLRPIGDLVYNEGISGSSMYYGGIMPKAWMDVAVSFHLLFQAIAWASIILAMIKLLFDKNAATINIASRVSLIDGVKDMLMAGFMLVSVFLFFNLAININEKLVSIMKAATPDHFAINEVGAGSQTLGGVFLQLYYFVITIYLNIMYIFRALFTAILIAAAPLFIVSTVFQRRSKRLFETWLRELSANVFLQFFHAFVLSLVLNVQLSSIRGIELAVISLALIPATKWFRSLITGNAGGMLEGLSMAGLGMAGGVAGGIAGGVAGAGASRMGMQRRASVGGSEDVGETTPGTNQNRDRKEHSTISPTNKVSQSARLEKSVDDKGTRENTEFSQMSGKRFKDVGSFDKERAVDMSKDLAKGSFDVVKGGAKVATGTAIGLALGGVGGGNAGVNMARGGISDIKGGAKEIGSTMGDAGKMGINKFSNHGGNILGMETLDNGDNVIHRDKEKMENMGFAGARTTSGNQTRIEYDTSKFNSTDKASFDKIKNAYENGDYETLRRKGIENVSYGQDGKASIYYNEKGREELGFKDIYSTKNRVVETKDPTQDINSSIIYDIDNASMTPPYTNYGEKGGMSEPTYGGEPYYDSGEPDYFMDDYDTINMDEKM